MGKPIIWKNKNKKTMFFQIYLIKIIAFLSGPLKKIFRKSAIVLNFFLMFETILLEKSLEPHPPGWFCEYHIKY